MFALHRPQCLVIYSLHTSLLAAAGLDTRMRAALRVVALITAWNLPDFDDPIRSFQPNLLLITSRGKVLFSVG